jgi:hypothetical protein
MSTFLKCVVFISIFSSLGSADSFDRFSKFDDSGMSPFEMLKAKFAVSGPAKIADFPTLEDIQGGKVRPLNQVSFIEASTKKEDITVKFLFLATVTIETAPAQPDRGPLLPATPAQTRTVQALVLSPSLQAIKNLKPADLANVVASSVSLTETPQGLVEEFVNSDGASTTTVRKLGNLIIAQLVAYNSDKTKFTAEMYTYAWQ